MPDALRSDAKESIARKSGQAAEACSYETRRVAVICAARAEPEPCRHSGPS